jgi:hypothetical protein
LENITANQTRVESLHPTHNSLREVFELEQRVSAFMERFEQHISGYEAVLYFPEFPFDFNSIISAADLSIGGSLPNLVADLSLDGRLPRLATEGLVVESLCDTIFNGTGSLCDGIDKVAASHAATKTSETEAVVAD